MPRIVLASFISTFLFASCIASEWLRRMVLDMSCHEQAVLVVHFMFCITLIEVAGTMTCMHSYCCQKPCSHKSVGQCDC